MGGFPGYVHWCSLLSRITCFGAADNLHCITDYTVYTMSNAATNVALCPRWASTLLVMLLLLHTVLQLQYRIGQRQAAAELHWQRWRCTSVGIATPPSVITASHIAHLPNFDCSLGCGFRFPLYFCSMACAWPICIQMQWVQAKQARECIMKILVDKGSIMPSDIRTADAAWMG